MMGKYLVLHMGQQQTLAHQTSTDITGQLSSFNCGGACTQHTHTHTHTRNNISNTQNKVGKSQFERQYMHKLRRVKKERDIVQESVKKDLAK